MFFRFLCLCWSFVGGLSAWPKAAVGEMGRFAMRNDPFRGAKGPISGCEMGRNASGWQSGGWQEQTGGGRSLPLSFANLEPLWIQGGFYAIDVQNAPSKDPSKAALQRGASAFRQPSSNVEPRLIAAPRPSQYLWPHYINRQPPSAILARPSPKGANLFNPMRREALLGDRQRQLPVNRLRFAAKPGIVLLLEGRSASSKPFYYLRAFTPGNASHRLGLSKFAPFGDAPQANTIAHRPPHYISRRMPSHGVETRLIASLQPTSTHAPSTVNHHPPS